jgi:hypothetical protein
LVFGWLRFARRPSMGAHSFLNTSIIIHIHKSTYCFWYIMYPMQFPMTINYQSIEQKNHHDICSKCVSTRSDFRMPSPCPRPVAQWYAPS